MLSASLAQRTLSTTFGQDSWGVRPSSSRTPFWTSTHTAHTSPVPTRSLNDDTIYVPDSSGRIIAQPKPILLPAVPISVPVSQRQASSGSGPSIGRGSRSPPRPSPQPEELRADLTCLQPMLPGTHSATVISDGQWDVESGDSRMGIITQTRQWVVRMEGGCM